MIVFDQEATGLIDSESLPLTKQPEVIEFAAVKLDDRTLVSKGELDFLCKPSKEFGQEVTKFNGITWDMVKDKPPFRASVGRVTEFFMGERYIVAHNCIYDCLCLQFELQRIGKAFMFPWPPERRCTVELSMFAKGHRLKLAELVALAGGGDLKGAHRAMVDVKGLCTAVRWLRKKKKI